MSARKKVLNVGGNTKAIALPELYDDFEHVLLDIDPATKPDLLCDARLLDTQEAAQFDAVYCSHNLEHYYRHDVPKVLQGFVHILKPGGIAHIRVPDLESVMRTMLDAKMEPDDTLYESKAGPISVLDVIYGYGKEIAAKGNDYYAHKTGFTTKSLQLALARAGFYNLYSFSDKPFELTCYGTKGKPLPWVSELFELPEIPGR